MALGNIVTLAIFILTIHEHRLSFHLFVSLISLFLKKYLFIYLVYLAALGLSCSIWDLPCGMWALSCGMWDLVPWPRIEPGPPALGVQSLNHWTTREVPCLWFLSAKSCSFHCIDLSLPWLNLFLGIFDAVWMGWFSFFSWFSVKKCHWFL